MLFDYDSIITELQNRLSLLSDWVNSLFLGVYQRIIDMIAYATEKIVYVAEFLYTEAGFITATLRESVMPVCKVLSYTPHRKIGASGNLSLSADSSFSATYVYTGESVTIPKWTQFKNSAGDTFVYCTEETIYYKNTVGSISIPVSEGVYTEYIHTALGNASEVITLYSDSIDNDNIEVFIVNSDNEVLYTVNICGVNGIANELFFINDLVNYYCKIENLNDFQGIKLTFGDGVSVRQLSANERVMIKHAITNGEDGNIGSTGIITSIQDTLYDATDTEVTLYVTNGEEISNGQDIETLTSIQYNAPLLWQSGYRAGTKADWAILLEAHSYIHKAKVWTNEDLISSNEEDVNKVFVTAVSTDGSDLTTSQRSVVNLYMKDYKSPSELIEWADLQIIWLLTKIEGWVSTGSFTAMESSIFDTLDEEYGILNVDFKQNVYESEFIDTLNNIANLDHHNSELYYMEKNFNSVTSNHTLWGIYTSGTAAQKTLLKPETLELYLNMVYMSGTPLLVGKDVTGVGSIIGQNGHSISGGAINYDTGVISFNDTTITDNLSIYGIQNTSGDVASGTYQLSVAYQTWDANSGQAGDLRLPYDYLITDVDEDYIITSLEYV